MNRLSNPNAFERRDAGYRHVGEPPSTIVELRSRLVADDGAGSRESIMDTDADPMVDPRQLVRKFHVGDPVAQRPR